ncbi:hypothetical protein V6N12_052535 [Hibiscus sabdariffa]|uniref:Ribosomal protein n=1 Tax=Hibiscus sabdariffa TaxID=183260 RepID=A0ABR2C231_9ROSI
MVNCGLSLMGECWLGMQVIKTYFRGATTLAVTNILNGVSQDSRNIVLVRSICELCQRQLSVHIKHIQRSQCYSRPDHKIVEQQQSGAHMLSTSTEGTQSKEKQRKFTEIIELQIGLKNYDPQKDKRFSGSVKLPHIPRPKMKICMLGDAQHVEEAEKIGLDYMDVEALKKLNKNKKLVKKLAKKYHSFLASESVIKQIPRLLGPGLNKAGKFPTLVTHQESLESKVNETKAMVKFQLKKVLCMGVAVGNVAMEEKQIFQNVQMSVNFLVSLLKKNWQNKPRGSRTRTEKRSRWQKF